MNETKRQRLRESLERSRALSPALLAPDDYVSRGNAQFRLENYEEAIREYDLALDLEPHSETALFNKGVALVRSGLVSEEAGDYEQALLYYDKALEVRPNYADAYFHNACLLANLKRPHEAFDNLAAAISNDADLRQVAMTALAFAPLRDDPRFRELVGEDDPPPPA